ncbi:hypothetical protein, partial [Pseudomonas sp. HMSC75E02]|uniref:hypothetical protein n=1 Tax=Pseudomonas sp. HMSC75E02 TaxID=1608908 RepID=UPI001C46963C
VLHSVFAAAFNIVKRPVISASTVLISPAGCLDLFGLSITLGQRLMFGAAASELGIRGELARSTVKTRLKLSFVRFSLTFPNSCRMDDMIPALWIHLGGMTAFVKSKKR